MVDLIQDHPIAQRLDQYTVEELSQHLDTHFENLDPTRLANTSPHEIGLFLERLELEEQRVFLRRVSEKMASSILAEMDAENSAEILSVMREIRAARIIELLDPDDAVDLISKLDESDRIRLLSRVNPKVAITLRKLLRYNPDTAGGVMTPNVAMLQAAWDVATALEYIKKVPQKAENVYNLYVLDDQDHLVGLTTLRNLVFSKPTQKISEIMNTQIQRIACLPETDKNAVASIMAEYNVIDVPVVDEQNHLLGCVTHDDVLDIVQEAATSDLQQMHGAGADESIHDSIVESLRKRNPWLMMNLVLAFLSASVISKFSNQIAQISYMAVFMTLVANLGGNTGAQALAVAIRGLAVGEFQTGDGWLICRKELMKGLLNGIGIGVCGGVITIFLTHNVLMGVTLMVAMIITMVVSGLAGVIVPLFLKRFHFDPAQSSYIILTTLTDIIGLFVFLKLGTYLLF